ncbi:MAG: hypothetical protein IKA02_03430, partial [Clostridia bacterium]|nr:hypothetical protein [Clostridia bacterium]
HYRVPASITKYFVPDMEKVKKDLLDVNNSLYLGIYCHLFLDYHFFENYIFKKYKWENGYVTVPHSNYKLSENDFFDKSGIYTAYGELNNLLLKSGKITKEDLSIIDEYLPDTNIDVFDKRREKTWIRELNEYLVTENEYSGKILHFDNVIPLLENLADTFINNIRLG